MSSVIAINPFEVPEGKEKEALATWEKFAAYFCKQSGYISTKLHRALGPEAKFHLVSISEWESPEHFMKALQNPELQEIVAIAPKDISYYPGLYQIIRS
ncbi:MAG: antibiotic biosynthesis monooxygenase family protein [Candidatus Zixiibacteriota bacterium]